ncbi:DUF1573 domain-containing protein [bacterium]|nr:DUF1573 domain-containing protein [bacterium]
MRPGAILVSIASLLLSLSVVVWLSHSVGNVSVDAHAPLAKPVIADLPDTPRPVKDGPQPTADFAETEYNFGTMRLHEKGSHAFKVTNNGEAPLKLKAGKSTCQCTVGEVGTQELAPGESTAINLSWEIKSQLEHFQHSATIHTNAPEHENGEVRLIVRGHVVTEVATFPSDHLQLGTVREGDSVSKSFVFYSRFHDQFSLQSIDCPNESFKVSFKPLSANDLEGLQRELISVDPPALDGNPDNLPVPPKCGYRVTVSTDDSLPVGTTEIPLTLHTDLENVPEFTQTVTAIKLAPFQFFPMPGTRYIVDKSIVTTPEFDSGKGVEMELLMLATGLSEPLEVSVVSTDPAWLEVTVEADKSATGIPRQRLKIRVPPGAPPIVRNLENPATIVLKTNHPKAEQLTLKATFASR